MKEARPTLLAAKKLSHSTGESHTPIRKDIKRASTDNTVKFKSTPSPDSKQKSSLFKGV